MNHISSEDLRSLHLVNHREMFRFGFLLPSVDVTQSMRTATSFLSKPISEVNSSQEYLRIRIYLRLISGNAMIFTYGSLKGIQSSGTEVSFLLLVSYQ